MKIIQAQDFHITRQWEYGTAEQNTSVRQIIADVQQRGDQALKHYAEHFDRVIVHALRVSQDEIQAAYQQVEQDFLVALQQAATNIRAFHLKQMRTSWMDLQQNGTMLGQIFRPLQRVGIYVPGGKAVYPSSVLMNAIPAQVAGVKEIVMVTPPSSAGGASIDPKILVAAAEAGVQEIYRVGGAQAIAALAYGTASIAPVDKIVGPGNIYVAIAKRQVFGVVDIDSIAGPSEIVVLADESADADYVAADLLSQAEHDEMASAILITDSKRLANAVEQAIHRQLPTLPKQAIAKQSMEKQGAIVIVENIEQGVQVVNRLAPEHLQIMTQDPMLLLPMIENAGAIFLGKYSAESVGDYFAGPNHVLPTNGTARFSSPLNIDDFVKKSSVIHYSKQAFMQDAQAIMTLARHEGLEGHARAIEIRIEKEGRYGGS